MVRTGSRMSDRVFVIRNIVPLMIGFFSKSPQEKFFKNKLTETNFGSIFTTVREI